MGKIVVIGGGEIKNLETLSLDKRVVALTGKKHPRALFIPTASGEPQGYIDTFKEVYGRRLGCTTDVLKILGQKPSKKELMEKILGADLIYVGGGNTLKMMRRWRLLGVDTLIKRAYHNGTVLSGLSAGGVCWFDGGHSDSMSFYSSDWDYIRVSGLGLLPGIHCPHFDTGREDKPRRSAFTEFMKKHKENGLGIDECAAVEFVDGKYRVLSASSGKTAYVVRCKGGRVEVKELPISKKFEEIAKLYS